MQKKAKTSTAITLIVLASIVLVALMTYAIFFKTQQTQINVPGTTGDGTYISTGSTALTLSVVDALKQGTEVAGTSQISVDKAAYKTGITSASPGNTLSVLFTNGTSYHAAYLESTEVPNAPTMIIPMTANKNASISMTWFNTNNLVIDGSAVNQSVAAGGSYNMQLRMDGQDGTSTQDMLCILETEDGSKVQKTTLTGFGAADAGISKPSWYTSLATTSVFQNFKVAPVAGAVSPTGTVGIQLKTGLAPTAGTRMKIDCYTYENFLDTNDGKVKYAVEDSLGNLKSIAHYSKTIYFQ